MVQYVMGWRRTEHLVQSFGLLTQVVRQLEDSQRKQLEDGKSLHEPGTVSGVVSGAVARREREKARAGRRLGRGLGSGGWRSGHGADR
jgi:hypothetical protein